MSEDTPQAIDPVCGMTVIPEKAAGSFDYQGMRYYFCGLSCLRRFEADPEQFVRRAAVAAPARAGTLYVCPMDPEIHQDHPGFCPKCGVALEPLNITFEDAPNPELVDMSRRFRMAALPRRPRLCTGDG